MWLAETRSRMLLYRASQGETKRAAVSSDAANVLPEDIWRDIVNRVPKPTDSGFSMKAVAKAFDDTPTTQTGCVRRHSSIPASVVQQNTNLRGCFTTDGPVFLSFLNSVPNEKLMLVTTLDISDNNIGDAGAGALLAKNMPHLTALNISANNIGGVGAGALANMPQLTTLDISFNLIGDVGAGALLAKNMPQLTTLNIDYNDIGDAGARDLAKNMPQLTTLHIRYNKIGDDGAIALAHMPQLTTLNINFNNIGEAGAIALANIPDLNQ